MSERKPNHLNSEGARLEFQERYGKEHGDVVWRETLSKVAREQAAKNPSGVKVEEIPGHISFSSKGTREHVKAHPAYVHAKPHGRGHHAGRCSSACRRGIIPHRHKSRR
jgi:hypothetical protein